MNTAHIFNIQHFSLHDGEGIRTVVFFKGCPLNCIWCHNPESKSKERELSFLRDKCVGCQKCAAVCPAIVHSFSDGVHTIDRQKCTLCGKCAEACAAGALGLLGKEYTIDEVMDELAKDNVFFAHGGGVTFSGGEPFAQFDALYELLIRCKEKGYTTCIETSGFANIEDLIKAAPLIDCFLFDCKETDSIRHKEFVGAGNTKILENLAALNKIGAKVVLRCPIIPNCNDRAEHFDGIAALCERFSCITSVELLPYHPLGIAKSEQIGKEAPFAHREFLDREALAEHCEALRARLHIPVKIQ